MRTRALIAIAAILVGLVVLQLQRGNNAAPAAFVGSWSSVDPVDGSVQHLKIVGGATLDMHYVDELGTTCVEIGASTKVFTGLLSGQVSGDALHALFTSAGCGSQVVLTAADQFSWTFEYDRASDTLWGATNDGPATWHRD